MVRFVSLGNVVHVVLVPETMKAPDPRPFPAVASRPPCRACFEIFCGNGIVFLLITDDAVHPAALCRAFLRALRLCVSFLKVFDADVQVDEGGLRDLRPRARPEGRGRYAGQRHV